MGYNIKKQKYKVKKNIEEGLKNKMIKTKQKYYLKKNILDAHIARQS